MATHLIWISTNPLPEKAMDQPQGIVQRSDGAARTVGRGSGDTRVGRGRGGDATADAASCMGRAFWGELGRGALPPLRIFLAALDVLSALLLLLPLVYCSIMSLFLHSPPFTSTPNPVIRIPLSPPPTPRYTQIHPNTHTPKSDTHK